MPVKNSVLKLDLEKGRDQGQVGVQLTTEDPVGNLFSDGEKLWVAGAGRVYAMTNLEHRMAMLQEKIAAGDGDAQLNRMRLYAKEKKFDETLADLRGSYQLFKASLTPDQAADKYFSAFAELKLAQDNPSLVLELLAEEFVKGASLPQLGKEMVARRNDILSSSLSVIRQKKMKGLTAQIMGIAPLLEPEYLQHAAAQTLDITYREEDLPALKEAVCGEQCPVPTHCSWPADEGRSQGRQGFAHQIPGLEGRPAEAGGCQGSDERRRANHAADFRETDGI